MPSWSFLEILQQHHFAILLHSSQQLVHRVFNITNCQQYLQSSPKGDAATGCSGTKAVLLYPAAQWQIPEYFSAISYFASTDCVGPCSLIQSSRTSEALSPHPSSFPQPVLLSPECLQLASETLYYQALGNIWLTNSALVLDLQHI